MAFHTEVPPATSSVVFESRHQWSDDAWMTARREGGAVDKPMSVYEVHLGSWRRGKSLRRDWRDELATYCQDLGFTHVEFLPVMEHPFGGSWGYQVTSYYAPTSRFGDPDGFRHLVDTPAPAGIGVILDWVPAHFPKDEFALARFDGTPLYEDPNPSRGEHPDWGTLRLQLRPPRGAQLPRGQRAVLARGVPRRRAARRRRRVDALPRLLARARRVDAQRARRPREPRGDAVPPGDERHRLQARARRDHDRRGVHLVARRHAAHVRRRPRLRPQVEHGLDARHARLRRSTSRCTGPTTTTS